MNMDVILPQKTKGQIGMEGNAGEGKYKTMYLLHRVDGSGKDGKGIAFQEDGQIYSRPLFTGYS